ncbi:MAG: SDR family oxidoreductase [Candidatus Poseidonia sp.]|jgi:NAD(P)-dependent dehydrogenase (short-subunit alcohol dehydrogenase family)|nr:SDR family oxidoreductase [Poseidonia sp.]
MPVALVTGANRGIGFEIVRQLLEQGHEVHATYRENQGGLATVNHPALHLHQMDVRREEDVLRVVGNLPPQLDILINNAGIADGRWGSIEEIDFAVVSEVLEVNAVSPVRVTKHILPMLEAADGGKVVMISSLMSSIADCMRGKSYAYRASKTALNMFTVSMKNELKERNISLLLLHPGWVETDMGGPNAPIQPEESVRGILERIAEQTLEMSGRFVDYTGTSLPW